MSDIDGIVSLGVAEMQAVLGDAARTNGYLLFYEAYEAVM